MQTNTIAYFLSLSVDPHFQVLHAI